MLYKIRDILPMKSRITIYNSLAGSYLNYGIISWGSATLSTLNKLKTMQNRLVRYITFSPPQTNVNHVQIAQHFILSTNCIFAKWPSLFKVLIIIRLQRSFMIIFKLHLIPIIPDLDIIVIMLYHSPGLKEVKNLALIKGLIFGLKFLWI